MALRAHSIDISEPEHHVRIELDGVVVAESRRARALDETGLRTRWYLPLEDVRRDLLVASDSTSRCPFKGKARYWSVRIGDELHEDLLWSYPDPIPSAAAIAGLVAFYDERVLLSHVP